MSDWWKSLSLEKQKEYLKEHPGSKRKLTRKLPSKVSNTQEKSDKVPAHPIDKAKKPNPSVLEKTLKHNTENKDLIPRQIEPTLQNMNRNFEHRLKSMGRTQKEKLSKEINRAIKLKDRGRIKKVTRKIGIMTGIISIGAVGLSLVTGMDLVLSAEALSAGFMDEIKHYADASEAKKQERKHRNKINKHNRKVDKHQAEIEEKARKQAEQRHKERVNNDLIKKTGEAYVNQVRKNVKNPEELNKAVMISKAPDVVIDEGTKNEAANIHLSSNHETDLTKAIIKIENLEVASQTESIINSSDESYIAPKLIINKLVNHIDMIESAIPSIASIFVSSISQKSSLSNRAKSQLSIFNRELSRCKEELASLGSKNSMSFKKTPLVAILKKNIKFDSYKYEVSYVKCESNNIRMCELHTFKNVDVAGFPISKVEVYGFVDSGTLNVALIKDSNFTPKAFSTIKPRGIPSWLSDNGVSV